MSFLHVVQNRSDFRLSSLLFSEKVPRCMRKGYGRGTLAAGKKVLDPDLCVYMALRLLVGLCSNDFSFWRISTWSVSFLCHCLWSGLQPDQDTLVLPADWLLSSCGHHRRSWSSASSSTQPLDNLTLCPPPSQAPLQTHRLLPQWHSRHAPSQRYVEPSRSSPPYTETSSYSGKPNPGAPSANHAAQSSVLWCDAHRLGHRILWKDLLPECNRKQTSIWLPLVFPVTHLTLLTILSWGSRKISGHSLLSCFSHPSSF